MKTTITILLLSIVVLITACQTTKTSTTEVVVLMDITEQYLVQPKSDDIVKLYDFKQNQWNGGKFRFSDITQVSLNPTEQTSIESANQWLSNEFQRDKEIEDFQKNIEAIITKAEQQSKGKDNSTVYLPIAKELNQLSQAKRKEKYCLYIAT